MYSEISTISDYYPHYSVSYKGIFSSQLNQLHLIIRTFASSVNYVEIKLARVYIIDEHSTCYRNGQ